MAGDGRTEYSTTHQADGFGTGYDQRYGTGFKHFFWTEIEEPLLSSILERLAVEHGVEKVLDFACGTGRILEVLQKRFDAPTGIDISRAMIDRAVLRCERSRLVNADPTDPSCDLGPDFGPFDLVTAFRFFLKAEDELRDKALAFIARVLRPGGFLVANTHNQPYSPHGIRSAVLERTLHSRQEPRLSYRDLVALAERHGFAELEHHPLGFLPGVKNHLPLPGFAYRKLDALVARSPIGARVCQNAIVVLEKR